MTRKPDFLAYFDQQERELAVYMACIHRDEQEARKANGNPEIFGVNKWIDWEDNTIDVLSSIYSTSEVSLSYVVRKD